MSQNIKIFQNALPKELCDRLMAKFNDDADVRSDPQPDYSTREFLFLSDKSSWSSALLKVSEFAHSVVGDYFTYPPPYEEFSRTEWFDDGYVLARYKPGDISALHDDGQVAGGHVRLATLLFYLNSVSDGGETYFPLQDIKVAPEQGAAVLFPPTLHYPHEVLPPKQDRYILQTWIVDPYLLVVEGNAYSTE